MDGGKEERLGHTFCCHEGDRRGEVPKTKKGRTQTYAARPTGRHQKTKNDRWVVRRLAKRARNPEEERSEKE